MKGYVAIGALTALLISTPAFAKIYISGRVLVNGTGAAAAGVTLALFAPGDTGSENPVDVALTLPNGAFVLKAPSTGPFRITGSGAAYQGLEQIIQVPKAGIASELLHIDQKAFVRIRLLAPDGRPVHNGNAQAWISLPLPPVPDVGRGRYRAMNWQGRFRRGLGMSVESTVARDGTVEIVFPDGTPHRAAAGVVVGARLVGTGCGQVTLDGWPHEAVTVPLAPGATLQGTVQDGHGNAAAGMPVIVVSALGSRFGRFSANADAEGHFRIDSLLPGDYRVLFRTLGGTRCTAEVSLKEPTTTVTLSPSEAP